MKAIIIYLKGIQPQLETMAMEADSMAEVDFINELLKEIAELPAIEEGE